MIVYLPTVQHTGTHFLSDILVRAHGQGGLFQIHRDKVDWYIRSAPEYHKARQATKIAISRELELVDGIKQVVNGQFFSGNDLYLLRGHIGDTYDFLPYDCVRRLMNWVPFVIPIRDPLIVCLSHKVRNPQSDCKAPISGFHFMSEIAKKQLKYHFLPVDLIANKKVEEREDWVYRMLAAVGLKSVANCGAFRLKIKAWTPKGHWRDVKLSIRPDPSMVSAYNKYFSGDFGYIKKVAGDVVVPLMKKESTLRPFLEYLGYSDLIWWT